MGIKKNQWLKKKTVKEESIFIDEETKTSEKAPVKKNEIVIPDNNPHIQDRIDKKLVLEHEKKYTIKNWEIYVYANLTHFFLYEILSSVSKW